MQCVCSCTYSSPANNLKYFPMKGFSNLRKNSLKLSYRFWRENANDFACVKNSANPSKEKLPKHTIRRSHFEKFKAFSTGLIIASFEPLLTHQRNTRCHEKIINVCIISQAVMSDNKNFGNDDTKIFS